MNRYVTGYGYKPLSNNNNNSSSGGVSVPQRAAHRISELNLFLYLRISGVSLCGRVLTGFTLTTEPLRDGSALRASAKRASFPNAAVGGANEVRIGKNGLDKTHTQGNRHTHRHTQKQTHKHTQKQTQRETDTHTDRNRNTHKNTHRYILLQIGRGGHQERPPLARQ